MGTGRTRKGIRIVDWEFDDMNIEELAAHGLTPELVDVVLESDPRFRRNKKKHAASHQMIGPDQGGRFWVVCIVEVGLFIWRPITGWDAAAHEIEWWRRSR